MREISSFHQQLLVFGLILERLMVHMELCITLWCAAEEVSKNILVAFSIGLSGDTFQKIVSVGCSLIIELRETKMG